MDANLLRERFDGSVVDFSSYNADGNFHIDGKGILTVPVPVFPDTNNKVFAVIEGDIIMTSPKNKIWHRIQSVRAQISDVFPGIREDFLLITDKIDMEGGWINSLEYPARHILCVSKTTGLTKEDLDKLSNIRCKSVQSDSDMAYTERMQETMQEHNEKERERILRFLQDLARVSWS